MDGRRYADEPEPPQWYGDRDWRTPAADVPAEDARAAATRPRRASDPLTDPTGFSDHWNAPRATTPEAPAEPEARSRRGYEYDPLTGRGLEALPVVTPAAPIPVPVPEPEVAPAPLTVPDQNRTAAYPLTGDIPRYRTEALDRNALRRPPADPAAAAPGPAQSPVTSQDVSPEPAPDPAPALHAFPADHPFPADHAFPADRAFTPAPGGERVYTTRRPILAVPIGLVVVLLEFPALRLLLDGFTGGVAAAGSLVGGLALALSLPLTGVGLYALLTTGRAADHRTWWRPPLAHLPLGLVLLVAAAVAVR